MEPETYSGKSLKLEVQGQLVTLAFASKSENVYLISDSFSNRWPSEILRSGTALLRIGTNEVKGEARLITSTSEKSSVMDLFRRKYGQEYVDNYFPRPGRFIAVSTGNVKEIGKWGYYQWLESEFDNIADEYDHHILDNRVNSLLRERSVELMKRVFPRRNHLLEIGCGTGTETLEMLKQGFEITATDISSRMIENIKEKARKEGLQERLTLHKLRAGRTSELVDLYGNQYFDGIYSNYGALNCEERIGDVPVQIHALLKDGGSFVTGVYNRYCLSELLAYAATFQLRKARDRLRKFSKEGHSRFCVDVYSYSPSEFYSLFRHYFRLRSLHGVPVVIPPSNMEKYVEKFTSHFDALKRVDRVIGNVWPFRAMGDHFLMVLDRKSVTG